MSSSSIPENDSVPLDVSSPDSVSGTLASAVVFEPSLSVYVVESSRSL